MPITSPSILIVASNSRERASLASVVEDAGLTVILAADDAGTFAALRNGAAAIVALPDARARDFLRFVEAAAPNAKLLMVMDANAAAIDDDRVLVARRPLYTPELIGQILDLMLQEDTYQAPRHGRTAELGIATAQLACLSMREASTAATGAARQMRDLSSRIADMRAGMSGSVMRAGAD